MFPFMYTVEKHRPLLLGKSCKLEMLQDNVLTKIFRPVGDEASRQFRVSQRGVSCTVLLRVVKSRSVRWAGHVVRTAGTLG